jgi:hypothetical protein
MVLLHLLLTFVATSSLLSVLARGEPSIDTAEATCPSAANNLNGNSLVWPPRSAHPLLAQLFPNVTEFTNAWEIHPLLTKRSRSEGDNRSLRQENHIPTNFHTDTSLTSNQSNSINSWISVLSINDIPTILSQRLDDHPLIHGRDYKLVKKIIIPSSHESAGEEYMGMLPKELYSIQEVLHNFHYKGFSLVIDKMQKRWRGVADKAVELEEALGVQHVGVNLYLTPEALEDEDGNGGWTDKQVRQGL